MKPENCYMSCIPFEIHKQMTYRKKKIHKQMENLAEMPFDAPIMCLSHTFVSKVVLMPHCQCFLIFSFMISWSNDVLVPLLLGQSKTTFASGRYLKLPWGKEAGLGVIYAN